MNKKVGILVCGLLALSLTGCQKKVDKKVIDNLGPGPVIEPETEKPEVVNPIVNYASAEALAAAIGFDITSYDFVNEPLSQVENAKISYQTIGGTIAQVRIDYDNGSYAEFRASKTLEGVESLAGVYGAGEGIPTSDEENAPLKYNLGAMEVLVFSQDGINFSILNSAPVELETESGPVIEETEEITEEK